MLVDGIVDVSGGLVFTRRRRVPARQRPTPRGGGRAADPAGRRGADDPRARRPHQGYRAADRDATAAGHRTRRRHDGRRDDGQGQRRHRACSPDSTVLVDHRRRDGRARPRARRGRDGVQPGRRRRRPRARAARQRRGARRSGASTSARWRCSSPTSAGSASCRGWSGACWPGASRPTVAVERMRQLVAETRVTNTVAQRLLPIERRQRGVRRTPTSARRVPAGPLRGRRPHGALPRRSGVRTCRSAPGAASFAVVTGPVGSGKITLLRAMLGLGWQRRGLRGGALERRGDRRSGRLPRAAERGVPAAGAATRVRLGERQRVARPDGREAIVTALELAAISDEVAAMPDAADTLIGPPRATPVGRPASALATARALVHRPELVVLDDLSSAVDVETEVRLWDEPRRRRPHRHRRLASGGRLRARRPDHPPRLTSLAGRVVAVPRAGHASAGLSAPECQSAPQGVLPHSEALQHSGVGVDRGVYGAGAAGRGQHVMMVPAPPRADGDRR